MTLAALLTQTVSIVTAGNATTVDAEGNPARAAAATTTSAARLEREVSLADRAETSGGPVESMSKWLLLLPPTAVLGQRDQVVADGVTYEVDGPPVVQRTPSGPHHIEARLRLVSS